MDGNIRLQLSLHTLFAEGLHPVSVFDEPKADTKAKATPVAHTAWPRKPRIASANSLLRDSMIPDLGPHHADLILHL